MSVFKRAKFQISSVIENIEDGESERSFSEAVGSMRIDGDVHLSYTEHTDGGDVHTSIQQSGSTVTVNRSGAISSLLVFNEGEHFSGIYSVPPYKFDMSVYARKVRCDIVEHGGTVRLIYDMEIGGAKKACIMKIEVQAASGGSAK